MARLLLGDCARQAIRLSLIRSVRAAAVSAGGEGGALLYERGGRTCRAEDGFEAARETADDQGSLSIGARMLKETLAEAQRQLGDGTARLALFTGAAVEVGQRLIAAGESPRALAEGLLAASARIEAALRARAEPAPPPMVTARAAGLPEPLADILAKAILHAGPDGAIDCRSGAQASPRLETGSGFLLDAETVSPLLPPFAGERLELAQPHVLVVNDRPAQLGRLADLLDRFATRGKALVMVARGASGAALDTLVVNGRQPGATLTALQPKLAGPQAVGLLEDLATATGAAVVDPALGTSLDSLRPAMLGRAERLLLTRGLATFVAPGGDPVAIRFRRSLIEAERERQRYLALDRERLEQRLARLSGRWAIITLRDERGVGEEETTRRLTLLRKGVTLARAAERDGVILQPPQTLRAIADEVRTGSLAGASISAGLCRMATVCSATQPDPVTILSGIVQRAISLTATVLRIEAIVAE